MILLVKLLLNVSLNMLNINLNIFNISKNIFNFSQNIFNVSLNIFNSNLNIFNVSIPRSPTPPLPHRPQYFLLQGDISSGEQSLSIINPRNHQQAKADDSFSYVLSLLNSNTTFL